MAKQSSWDLFWDFGRAHVPRPALRVHVTRGLDERVAHVLCTLGDEFLEILHTPEGLLALAPKLALRYLLPLPYPPRPQPLLGEAALRQSPSKGTCDLL